MKEFSKRLALLERELVKNKDQNNNFYKITSKMPRIPI
jgi:hypothetical protein